MREERPSVTSTTSTHNTQPTTTDTMTTNTHNTDSTRRTDRTTDNPTDVHATESPARYQPGSDEARDDQREGKQKRFCQKMKEMDHRPPVDGPNRTFERNCEGRQPTTDGGTRRENEQSHASDENESHANDGGGESHGSDGGEQSHAGEEDHSDEEHSEEEERTRFRQKMKDMDHSSPVEGANRTFKRGSESRDTSE